MNVNDILKYIKKSNDFKQWKLNRVSSKSFLKPDILYIDLNNECNLNCKFCCSRSSKEYDRYNTKFDYDMFYKFFNMFLLNSKKIGIKKIKLMLSGGELTLIDPKEFLDFLLNVVEIIKSYGLKFQIYTFSNLYKVKEIYFDLFRLIKYFNMENGNKPVMHTSTDFFHYPDGNFDHHIKNIKKVNDLGIKCIIIICVTGKEEEIKQIKYIKSKYKNLDIEYGMHPTMVFSDLDENYEMQKSISQAINNNRELYRDFTTHIPPALLGYTWSNAISLTRYHRIRETNHMITSMEDLNKIDDFLAFEYITNILHKETKNLIFSSVVAYYYKNYIKKDISYEQIIKDLTLK